MSNKILTFIGITILVMTIIVVKHNITRLSLTQRSYQNMTESQQKTDHINDQSIK